MEWKSFQEWDRNGNPLNKRFFLRNHILIMGARTEREKKNWKENEEGNIFSNFIHSFYIIEANLNAMIWVWNIFSFCIIFFHFFGFSGEFSIRIFIFSLNCFGWLIEFDEGMEILCFVTWKTGWRLRFNLFSWIFQ